MINPAQIGRHMEVVGSDGRHVGTVDRVDGGDIELSKFDFGSGFKHHLIPVTWVEMVDTKVHLSMTCDAAKAGWREKGADH